MTDPFSALFDGMFGSAMAEMIDLDYLDGTAALQIPALIRVPDTEGNLGEVVVSHDVRQFELRVSDLPIDPARGHRITRCADLAVYEVQSTPRKDRLGHVWIIDAYLTS